MRLVKYIKLMNELSKIEGAKESLKGQQVLSIKHYRRGDINEEIFQQQSQDFDREIRALDTRKRSALRHYIAA